MNDDGAGVITEQPAEPPRRLQNTLLVWLIVATILCGVLMVAATALPPRLRLLGLTAAVLGVGVGAIVSQTSGLAGRPALQIQSWIAANHALLVILGAVTIEYRQFQSSLPEQAQTSIAETFAQALAEDGADSEDAAARAHFQALQERLEERKQFQRSRFTFSRYLQFRFSGLGEISGGVAWGLFGGEVVIGVCLAAFVAQWMGRDTSSGNSAAASNSP